MTASRLLRDFHAQVAARPDHPAFLFDSGSVTYAAFGALVQGVREQLAARAPEETRIAIHATSDVGTYAAILGVLMSGRAYVPLNPKSPGDRSASCLSQAGIRTVLCTGTPAVAAAWQDGLDAPLQVLDLATVTPSPLEPPAAVSPDDLAYLLFTSGSTGTPKGVPIHHRQLDAFLRAFVDDGGYGFGPDDRVLQMFDLTFDLSVMSYAVPLVSGGTCVPVPEGPGFIAVARTLAKRDVTVALMVPSVLTFLERYFDEIDLPQLRLSMFCGEALPEALARRWWRCAPNARLLNVYGPTEATIFLSQYELAPSPRPSDARQGIVALGTPLAGSEFRIVDDRLEPVPPGTTGELILLGAQVTTGYWQNAEKTAAAFVTMPDGARGYRSGDLAVAEAGTVFYCGRADHQLKIDGYRVEPGEIEHHARAIAGVRDAVALGVPMPSGGTQLVLLLLAEGGDSPDRTKACRAHLAAHLPPYMVPSRVHVRPEFPLNANGKVDRRALRASLTEPAGA